MSPQIVDQAIQFEKDVCKCAFLFFFDVNDRVMVERLLERGKKSGRVDDNEETIKKRLDTFHTHTDPILKVNCRFALERERFVVEVNQTSLPFLTKYFGDRVIKINCEREVDSIFKDVCSCVDTKCKL